MTFSGSRATPGFLWTAKRIVHSHGFGYHKDRCYTAEQNKLVTGVMICGRSIAILPSKEHEIWRRTHDLGSGDLETRLAAVKSLIGSVVAAGQIEARLLDRLKRLRNIKASVKREAIRTDCRNKCVVNITSQPNAALMHPAALAD